MTAEHVFFYAISALAVMLIAVIPLAVLRGRRVVAQNARLVDNQTQLVANDARRVAALEQIAASLARIEARPGATPRG